jgi:hypothetical protein
MNSAMMNSADNDQSATETTAVNTVRSDHITAVDEQGCMSVKSLGSREKLQIIKEEFHDGEPEITRVDIRQQALQQAINQSDKNKNEKKRHYDYVLVYKSGDNLNTQERLREKFEAELEEEGFKIEKKYSTLYTFVILHCPFERLCIEAEYVILQMPLAGVSVEHISFYGTM